ncbi:MAG: glycosyltransferase [Bacteroidetes bacterium]|nr:glycosyltransferase [Bacteroidota bacterium]
MLTDYLFGAGAVAQMVAQGAIFFSNPQRGLGKCPALSVVICGRNAEQDWKKNFPEWMRCKASGQVEFILVDDDSQDNSLRILDEFSSQDERVRVVRLTGKKRPGKRDALRLGLTAASHPQVFVTDADCRPDSPQFLEQLMEILGPEPALFIGNGTLMPGLSISSIFAAADADRLGRMNFAALPWIGYITAVGRNMAYPRDIGLAALRYSSRFSTVGGDDDLALPFLVQRCRIKRYSPSPRTESDAPETYGAWRIQKHRHWTTAPHYPTRIKAVFLSRWLVLAINTLALISIPFQTSTPLIACILLGWLIQFLALGYWQIRFRGLNRLPFKTGLLFLLAELLAIFVPLWLLVYGSKKNGNTPWTLPPQP